MITTVMMMMMMMMLIIIITYLTRVNPSAEAVINTVQFPKISPSKYKPPKWVTQKTLR